MSFICRTLRFLKTTSAIGPCSLGSLFVISAGLFGGNAPTASAIVVPSIPYIQEIEDEDIEVKVQQLVSDDGEKIEVVVVGNDDSSHQEIAKKIKLKHLEQLGELAGNVEVEVLVHDEGESRNHTEVLKKLKSRLDGRLNEFSIAPDENVEVIVLDEMDGKHKAHFHELHGDADDKKNVFVFEADGEGKSHSHLHKHLIEIIHGTESGKMSRKALAKKLRQLADRIESGDEKHGATHKANRTIKIIPSGDHELHFEGRGKDDNHEEFEFRTKSGNHIVIGKPGQSKTMVVEVQAAGETELHSHDTDKKKFRWHGKKSPNAAKNIFVEKIHKDADHDPKELAQKILGKIKNSNLKHDVVEKIVTGDKKHNQKAHGSNSFVWKSAPRGIESSIQKLRSELQELRRELKELKADRKND